MFGSADLVARIQARGLQTKLSDIEQQLAADGGNVDCYIDPAKMPEAYRYILHEIVHLPQKLPHIKALIAIGMEWDLPNAQGITPVQLAGWNGLPDVMAYFLKLAPDLGHVNNYGGSLLSTILHGSENNPKRAGADYESRLRMALDHGVALPKQAIRFAGDDDLRALLEQWARDRPGQVVEHGPV